MGLVYLPLVVVEVIAQRGGEQGQNDGQASNRRWLGLNRDSDMGELLVGVGHAFGIEGIGAISASTS